MPGKTKKHNVKDADYSVHFSVDQSPLEVFAAVNKVRDWWSGEITGSTDKLGSTFTYRVPDAHYSEQTIAEWIPGSRVLWRVSKADLTFVKTKDEWNGTEIVFDIVKKGTKTELIFTHRGLVPDFECHEACSNAWSLLVGGNLRRFILTGKPQPSPW